MPANSVKKVWFDKIMAHAKAHYGVNGWDSFVECVDLAYFVSECDHYELVTYELAFEWFQDWCDIHAEAQEEHDAEADWSW